MEGYSMSADDTTEGEHVNDKEDTVAQWPTPAEHQMWPVAANGVLEAVQEDIGVCFWQKQK